MDLLTASFKQIAENVRTKKLSAVEVADFFQKRVQAHDKKLNSYITENENLNKEAKQIDERIAKGEDVGVLAGVPFGIKDMFFRVQPTN